MDLRRDGLGERVIGIGMDSTERRVDLQTFAEAFQLATQAAFAAPRTRARMNGSIAVALGRFGRSASTTAWRSWTTWSWRCVAERRIPLDVCQGSNIVIANKYPSLAEHPFRRMRQMGLLATLNTDDPAMTDLDLGREYRSVAQAQAMPWDEVTAVALDGIEASWLSDDEKRACAPPSRLRSLQSRSPRMSNLNARYRHTNLVARDWR